MVRYKIRYGEYGHDCWGASEWFGWYDYDNIVYTNCDECEKAIKDAKEQFPYKEFEMYELNIK